MDWLGRHTETSSRIARVKLRPFRRRWIIRPSRPAADPAAFPPPTPFVHLDALGVWPYHRRMATTTIKSTYSLDVESVRALETLAARWKVSKSEVLRRAIRAAWREQAMSADGPMEALTQLQKDVQAAGVDLNQWVREARAERRAWTIAGDAPDSHHE